MAICRRLFSPTAGPWLVSAALAVFSVACWWTLAPAPRSDWTTPELPWPLMVLLLVAVGSIMVQVSVGAASTIDELSMLAVPLAILTARPAAVLLGVFVGTLVREVQSRIRASRDARSRRLVQLVFNVAMNATQAGVAVLAFRLLLPRDPFGWQLPVAVALAIFAYVSIAALAMRAVMRIMLGRDRGRPSAANRALGASIDAVAAALSCSVAGALLVSPVMALMLLLPAAALWQGSRSLGAVRHRQQQLAGLLALNQRLQEPLSVEGIEPLLERIASVLNAAHVELCLIGDAGRPPVQRLVQQRPVGATTPVLHVALATTLQAPVGAGDARLVSVQRQLRTHHVAAAPLRIESRTVGMLLVAGRMLAVPARYTPDEVALLGTVATQVSSALEKGLLAVRLQAASAEREQLAHSATHDALTELPNRRGFELRFNALLVSAQRGHAALLYIDLDGFKAVNDDLGHAAGDALLATVAQRLTAQLRSGDTAARLGGDEFAVLLDGARPADAKRVAARIIAALGEPVVIAGRTARVGASIGIVTVGHDDRSSTEELMRRADAAMYAAKRMGKGRYMLTETA